MGKVQWIKVSTDVLQNRKIMALRYEKNGNLMILLWFSLLVLAGQTNDNGAIYFTPTIPYTDEKLNRELNIPKSIIKEGLKYFQDNEMIKILENGHIVIENWEEYQNFEKLERIKLANRERQKRYQTNHKTNVSITPNITPTLPLANATDKNRIDESRIEKNRVVENSVDQTPSETDTTTETEGSVIISFTDDENEQRKKAAELALQIKEKFNGNQNK
jgi:predicted phage replisome organizer